MSSRTVTQREMDRRLAMASAKIDITKAMENHDLTALEWANVLHECLGRIIQYGLHQEWSDDQTS